MVDLFGCARSRSQSTIAFLLVLCTFSDPIKIRIRENTFENIYFSISYQINLSKNY